MEPGRNDLGTPMAGNDQPLRLRILRALPIVPLEHQNSDRGV